MLVSPERQNNLGGLHVFRYYLTLSKYCLSSDPCAEDKFRTDDKWDGEIDMYVYIHVCVHIYVMYYLLERQSGFFGVFSLPADTG